MLLKKTDFPQLKKTLFEKQQGLCCICNKPLDPDIDKNHLDHDHALDGDGAGRVRSLLCNLCNVWEGVVKHKFNRSGLAKDNDYVTMLKSLVKYLEDDYTTNPLHPQYPADKAKQFNRLGKDEMIVQMKLYNFEYLETDTKKELLKKFKKQFKKAIQ